jgi:hypothetical protein
MQDLFKDFNFVQVYIDDLIIHSANKNDHINHLLRVLEKLNNSNLKVNLAKCFFAFEQLEILGYLISSEGIQVSKKKLLQMNDWTPPRTGKDLQSKLGFINYFRELIPLYSSIMEPLEQLRNAKTIEWTDQYQKIFDKIKGILASHLILSFPDFSKPFFIATDASQSGIAGVLFQKTNDKQNFISFAARSLSKSERNYGATQRELLAIIFSLQKFNDYIYGIKFTLYTDHHSLIHLFTQKKSNYMINKWIETLLLYDFEVVHIRGIRNILPDKLSRFYENEPDPSDINLSFLTREPLDLEVIETLEVQQQLLSRAHQEGHFGAQSLVQKIAGHGYSWKGIYKDAVKFVSSCLPCQKYNIGKVGYHPLTSITADLPLDHLAIDLKEMPRSTQGNNYILVIVDIFTRFVILRAFKSKKEREVAKALVEVFLLLGFPKILQSDNGKEFCNSVINEITRIALIDKRTITAYHPQANGVAERWIGTIQQSIYKLLEGKDQLWDLHHS